MHVEYHILDEAAKQLGSTIGTNLPLNPPDWSVEDLQTLTSVMDELDWSDFVAALRAAAERLPEPDGEG